MSDSNQNIVERIQERVRSGEITIDQANVEMVRMERVRLVTNRMPRQVRKALNEAVKRGELDHMKKDGHKPECYYHPTFDYLAKGERARREDEAINALKRVAGFPG